MAAYRSNKSRLVRREINTSYQRLVWTSLGTIVLILAFIFLGIPALVKFSALVGDIKSSSEPINKRGDDAILLPPRFETLPEATNSARITIHGFAQAGKSVEIFLNDDSKGEITVDNDGKFVFPNLSLKKGENKIRAYTIEGQQKSDSSQIFFVTFDNAAPKLEITKPEDGNSFSGENKDIQVEGKTDPENSVTINDRWVIVSQDGSFNAQYTLTDGENNLKIKAVNPAGNETIVERKFNYSP